LNISDLQKKMSDAEDKNSAVSLGRSRSIKRQKPDAPRKHVSEIISTDNEDESLRKYKLQLLGDFENLDIKSGETAKLQIQTLEIICHADKISNQYPGVPQTWHLGRETCFLP